MMRHTNSHMVDDLELALLEESRARAVAIAIGEQLRAVDKERHQPTEEELCLHAHLVREWQRKAEVAARILSMPLR